MTRAPSSDRWIGAGGVIAALFGLALAALAMFAAWEHNPQGEFHELAAEGTTIIHWTGWLLIGAGWFVVGAGTCCLGMMIVAAFRFALARVGARASSPRRDDAPDRSPASRYHRD